MTPEERAAMKAALLAAGERSHALPYGPIVRDLSHGPYMELCLDRIAAAIREAVKAEREECAKIADDDASLIAPMLAGASRRYAVREALHDLGYQGDPDAEIISLEAAKGMAEGLAAAIRARTP